MVFTPEATELQLSLESTRQLQFNRAALSKFEFPL